MRGAILGLLLLAACEEAGDAGFGKAPVPRPTLAGASSEPVLLRYRYDPGERTAMDVELSMRSRVRGAATLDQAMKMKMVGEIAWSSVDGDTFSGVATFTRLDVKLDMTGEGMPAQHLSWSSDQGGGPRELEPLRAMIGLDIPIKVTDRGRVTETDFLVVREALGRAGAPSEMMDQLASPRILESTFQLLPEGPVGVGDAWDSGHIVNETPVMTATVDFRLKVLAISSDRTEALLEAVPTIELEASGPAEIKSKKTAYDGWIRFDIDEGDVAEGANRLSMKLEMAAMGQRMDVSADADVRYVAQRK